MTRPDNKEIYPIGGFGCLSRGKGLVTATQYPLMRLTFLHLAARMAEVFNLTWEDIDFGNSQIRLWTNKRKGGIKEFDWLPMTPEFRQVLMQW